MNKKLRRKFLIDSIKITAAAGMGIVFPVAGCRSKKLKLDFLTIKDPDGWHENLRLKGDWLAVKISDGRYSGYGEISHSNNDLKCKHAVQGIFERYIEGLNLSLESLKILEDKVFKTAPDFITATAVSGINQALYELLAKQKDIPVWRLFAEIPVRRKIKVYTTINRSLKTRSISEYLDLVGEVKKQGFEVLKCAPFEKVTSSENVFENSRAGLATLQAIRKANPEIGIRIDFHERFQPANFYDLLTEIEPLHPDWIEEPFKLGPQYMDLQKRTNLKIAGGELYYGNSVFQRIIENQWVDVIMPDVKHIGGFGPLLNVCRMADTRIEVSPHNPAGPISTAASIHCAALNPGIRSLEYAFDKDQTRRKYGEKIEKGFLYLNDEPGWGLDL